MIRRLKNLAREADWLRIAAYGFMLAALVSLVLAAPLVALTLAVIAVGLAVLS